MQNSPSQVQICTGASCRKVRGICRMAEKSSTTGELPVRSSGWSEISGGYSLVVHMVHRTAARNTAAPTVKEIFTVGGIACPATLAPDTPSVVRQKSCNVVAGGG